MKSSSRVNLYLPANLVEALKSLAESDERSLNEYIMRILRRHVAETVYPSQEPRRIIKPEPREEIALKMG
jgi:hypothetical protein